MTKILTPSFFYKSQMDETCACRVSSVLNRDVKQFGKKHMFDNDDETCWNSDQVRNCSIVLCLSFTRY